MAMRTRRRQARNERQRIREVVSVENKERGREPVIVTEAGHFQPNGICLENLQDIGGNFSSLDAQVLPK